MHNLLYIKADGLWMYIHCLNFLFHIMCNIYYDINMFGCSELCTSELGSIPGSSVSNARCPLWPNPRGYFELLWALFCSCHKKPAA